MSSALYPDMPGWKGDSGTGKAGARMTESKAGTRGAAVLAALARGPATAEEIGQRIDLHWYLARPRLSELKARGLVIETGRRGMGALGGVVNEWRLTTAEERVLYAASKVADTEKSGGDA